MSNLLYLKLIEHVGHTIECVTYGMKPHDVLASVSIECVDCNAVLVDADCNDENEKYFSG